MCNDVLKLNVDYVYAKWSLGKRRNIAEMLNKSIKDVERVIADRDKDCVKQVFRVFCHFYLPPCGNTTHPAPPSSICQEECQTVQDNCRPTWDSLMLAFKVYTDILIDCSDTSQLLFPVPHCCTGAGIGLSRTHTSSHFYLSFVF